MTTQVLYSRPETTALPQTPAVSVVVPTFREAANIPELVERIERAAPNAEIIIVDDNSNDGTETVRRRVPKS